MKGDANADLPELVRDAVRAEVGGLFDELRRFFERRLAELSTEILATLDTVHVNETHLSDQLHQIHGEISRLTALPNGATRNSGLDLEGVIEATDAAANRILGAAETIRAAAAAGGQSAEILDQVNEIFEACSFQDLTGQRIRRVLAKLQLVDGTIVEMVEQSGAHPMMRMRSDAFKPVAELGGSGADLSQTEIDKLFA
jgi:chemotaxis protein CheZ